VFAIELRSVPEAAEGNGGPAEAPGTIVIGDFAEAFRAPLGFWGTSEYRRSWRRAFEVLDAGTRSVSCLMTAMTDPRISNFVVCWPMYRDGEDVYIQNAIIFLDEAGVRRFLRVLWLLRDVARRRHTASSATHLQQCCSCC